MTTVTKWYEKQPLSSHEIDEIKKEEGFIHRNELKPGKVKVGSKIEVIMNNGLRGFYTITEEKDSSGFHVVGRDETVYKKKEQNLP